MPGKPAGYINFDRKLHVGHPELPAQVPVVFLTTARDELFQAPPNSSFTTPFGDGVSEGAPTECDDVIGRNGRQQKARAAGHRTKRPPMGCVNPLLRLLRGGGQCNPAVSSSRLSVAKGISTLAKDDESFASLRDVAPTIAVTFWSQPAALSPIADEG